VGWSKQDSASSDSMSRAGLGKVASTRPDAIARANPAADQRVAWAKGNFDVTIPRLTEQELLQQLALAPGVGLGGSAQRVLKSWSSNIKSGMSLGGNGQVMDASPLLSVRPDLTMLPLRSGVNCQLPAKAASTLAVLARKLHVYIDGLAP